MPGRSGTESISPTVVDAQSNDRQANRPRSEPREQRLQRAGSFDGDVRSLPATPPRKRERPEHDGPRPRPVEKRDGDQVAAPSDPIQSDPGVQALSAPAPGPSANFDGLDFQTWGAGHPPDTNGDVGPNHYIQTINTAIGIYSKSGGAPIAAFTFDTLMSQGNFGNLCDTDNFGDPVVLYDTFEDRWVITDFAFQLDAGNNVINPPGAFQCFAVSKTGDPVAGGWSFYSINTTGGLGDYPKLGIWPDGIYMSVNMFDYAFTGSFQNVRLYAFNKQQMYAGASSVQSVSFDLPAVHFTVLPANARLQTGTPPAGSPNYFASVWQYLNAVEVFKFHVDWNSISLSTLTGPDLSIAPTSWINATNATSFAASSPANRLDTLYPRLMVQNQYSNIAGIESLWNAHTVPVSNVSLPIWKARYYQVTVTGGAVAANVTQAADHSPDVTMNRFMPGVAINRAGDMAIGYTTANSTTQPALKYAGRLASDPINTLPLTEQTLFQGAGSQSGTCGGQTCERWGDYSAMSLDVDGCTFWYTNEYYATTGLNNRTRIGAFSFPSCNPVSVGNLQGVVRNPSNNPIAGAMVSLGSRTTTTDINGNYSFVNLAAGTYPGGTATFFGYTPATFAPVVIPSGGTLVHDFVLGAPPAQNGCFIDTSQTDFQAGIPTNCDLTTAAGSVQLAKPVVIDQQNLSVNTTGFGFNATSIAGQTFKAAVSGTLTKVAVNLFCSGCSGTTPDVAVSIRATSLGVPTGGDLAAATIPGFNSGSGGFFTAEFAAPMTVTAGTTYAVLLRATANPSAGTYAYLCSCTGQTTGTNPYVDGSRVTPTGPKGSWETDQNGRDLGFKVFVLGGFATPGTFISSLKDANPAAGGSAAWGTISWTASTPANTSIQFHVAASSNPNGPFNFVGPFVNGASMAQFNGARYLKYRATLTTSSSAATPVLQDVSICFNNVVPAASATHSPNAVTFGKKFVGTTTPSSPPVIFSNNGPGALVFTAFNGAAPASSFTVGSDFAATTTCPLGAGGLASGGTCQFTFTFSPVAAGSRAATLTVATNDANMPHLIALSGSGFVVDAPTVTTTVVSGAPRLQQLQNSDGGWFFGVTDTCCDRGPGLSCSNLTGTTALGLLSAYARNGSLGILNDAIQAGQLLKSIHDANPGGQPKTQDLEFLVALTAATSDPQYQLLATSWFANLTTQFPNPADRADAEFTRRGGQNVFTLAVWDVASIIRMAKAAGDVAYATGLANRVIAREGEWKDQNIAHRWDQCANPAGCGPIGNNQRAFDYTLLGMGSMLWAIHDLTGFTSTISSYRSWLLSQQDAAGSWDAGNLQITAYAALGLGQSGGAPTPIQNAVAFFIERQLANNGWPFSYVNGVAGGEFSPVDSEVMRAMDLLYSTQQGQSIQTTPSQLATVTFSDVSESGSTTMVAQASSGTVPWGYRLVEGRTYDVQTTAAVSGLSTVCFGEALTNGLSDVRILHLEGSTWVDRTSSTNCASADSLDQFAIGQLDPGAVDTDPPHLSVTLSPAVVTPPNNKMIAVSATITVTDNADPSPIITLVSITQTGGSNGNNKDDVEDAAIGTDDRVFSLRAEKGRSYTIVYRATDRSGNASEVSQTVSVK